MKRAVILGLIGAVGIAVIVLADRHFRAETQTLNELSLRHALARAAEHLTDDLGIRITVVESLAGFMRASETLPGFDRFDQFSAILLRGHKTIRGLAYVDPRGVIRHFYPLRGNEAAVGLDLMRRPAAPFVTAAIRERRTTVNHPTQTVQGSLAVIARTPFYRDGKLAGLVQGVFDISTVVTEATANLNPRIGFMLHDAENKLFFGANPLYGDLQTTGITVGDNRWTLTAGWLAGPPGPAPVLLGLLWGGGGLLLLSLWMLVGHGMAREQELRYAVAERTRTLHESESRLSEAQRLAHIGSWELDLVSNRLVWSKEIYNIFEIDPDRFSPSYETFLEKVHPEDRETVNRAYTESVKNRTSYDIVHRLLMKDARVKYVHERCETHYDDQGRPLRSLGTAQDISERRRTELALENSESNLRALAENANIGILVNHRGRHVFANPRLLAMLGYSAAEIRETGIQELVHPDECERVMQRFRDRQAGKPVPGTYETVFVTRRGDAVPVELTATLTTWMGEPAGLVFLHDISARVRAQEEMRKLSGAVEQTADSVMITDRQGVIEYVNPAFERNTGYSRAEAVGGTPRLLKSGKQGQAFYEQLWCSILAGEVFSDVLINRKKDGSLYYEEKTISPLKDGAGRITHFVATGKDVSERMQAQERLQHMAQHDALTELPNRMLFLDRLKQALARARWHERLVAVLFIDLDRFKTINDSLGHEAGDRLLQALAGRFTRSVREGDTVARFGGDEFVILLDDVASEKDIGTVAQKVLEALAPSFSIDGQNLYITASIGVSLYPNDGEDSGTLLKHADIAMYRAKELGKNTYQFYSADMSARAFERLTLESSLRHAIERQEFRLYYQPQIDIVSGRIVGVEALLRWQHPDFGLVTPAEFIPLLEETGLIVPVGEWVFHTACARLCDWHAAGWPMLRLAVNLSPRQFQASDLATMVERGLTAVGCDPGLIELEITEGLLLRHAGSTLDTLDALRTLGVRLAIDDFGTGYSSLSYLRRYSIDTLKIDRSFVHDVPQDPDDSAITAAIISLAQSLMLEVIAEGVETAAQRDFLRSHGCRVMQGYLFSSPLPPEDISRLLAEQEATGGTDPG